MPSRKELEIEFNPAYIAEARWRFGDLEKAIKDSVPWVISRILPARGLDVVCDALDELPPGLSILRAIIAGELLAMSGARPDVRLWLCDYLFDADLSEGARYHLAGVYTRLGAEARRADRLPEAVDLARRGLNVVADLPPLAVTANLYYNLGVAHEVTSRFDEAIGAFEDSAEIDELIGRYEEAAHTRECLRLLAGRT